MICIFSVVHDTQRPGGGIELHASELGFYEIRGIGEPGRERADYAVCLVPDEVVDRIYIGQDAPDGNFYRYDHNDGRKFAQAIVDACRIGGGGVAVAAGPEPSPEEIAIARERYYRWLDTMFREGQNLWAEHRKPNMIPHFARVGALVLGHVTEWISPVSGQARKRCENCDGMIPQRVAWCPTCGFIYDMDRAVAGGHLPAIQARKEVLATAALLEEREAREAAAEAAPAGGRAGKR